MPSRRPGRAVLVPNAPAGVLRRYDRPIVYTGFEFAMNRMGRAAIFAAFAVASVAVRCGADAVRTAATVTNFETGC